jgi:hypothetical protein
MDVFSMELVVLLSFVKTSEFKGRFENPPSMPLATGV